MDRWKVRTNRGERWGGVVLLVIVMLSEWTSGQNSAETPRKLVQMWTSKNLTDQLGNGTFHAYFAYSDDLLGGEDEEYVRNMTVNSEEYSDASDEVEDPQLYSSDINGFYGESVSDTLFHESTNNLSLIFTDLSRCLYDYNLLTCLKMLLLNRVNNMIYLMDKNNLTHADLHILNGFVTFKVKNDTGTPTVEEKVDVTEDDGEKEEDDEKYLNIDEELSEKILQLFKNRSLRVMMLPGFGFEFAPVRNKRSDEFVCFTTRTFFDSNFNGTAVIAEMRKTKDGSSGGAQGQKPKKKKKDKGGFNMMPMMIVPQMIMMGFLPFALANLKMMVMNAFMVNSMALNGAIMMTIRNLIFGPKGGPKIKYVNYGYSKARPKSKRPEVIVHSPAAFVKPEVHKKPRPVEKYPPYPESLEEPSGPYPPASSEFEEPQPHFNTFDYDHSSGIQDFTGSHHYQEYNGNNHLRRQSGNRYPVQRQKPNRRKVTGIKRDDRTRLKSRNHIKNLKVIPLQKIKSRTTTVRSVSYEESEEGSVYSESKESLENPRYPQYIQHPQQPQFPPVVINTPDVRYHFNMPSTESSNSWSVHGFTPSIPTQYTFSTTTPTQKPFLANAEVEYPDFDILKVMPTVKNRIYPVKSHTDMSNPEFQPVNHHHNFDQNHIDRNFNVKANDGQNSQQGSEYRNVFSSKYNKELTNFDHSTRTDSKHKNHNYART